MTTKDDSYTENLKIDAEAAAANARAAFWDGWWLGGLVGVGLMLSCVALAFILWGCP